MIFGREFNNFPEALVSSIAQLCFTTSLIVIYSYVILKEKRESYLLRGFFVGFGSWFAIMSLCYVIGIHKILIVDLGSAISFFASLIWGMLGAWFLHKLDERYES